uniref:Reverse transcriptase Ty1/copia-type domain-containing protein n=1 Tax=Solanum lycopersicum TaxID=4081 RepID=A0A3Q7EWD0_SOLLC
MEKWLRPADPSSFSFSSQPFSPIVPDPIPTPPITNLVNSSTSHRLHTQDHLDDVPTGSIWSHDSLIIIMIYIVDIVVTSSNNSHVLKLYVHAKGLTLTQSSFIEDILSKFNMLDANSESTPLSTSDVLSLDDGSPPTDGTIYRQVIGSLLYLSFTRPDICFAVNKLAQFQQSPSAKHWQATKRLLGDDNLWTSFQTCNSSQLLAYSNADWGGIPDTRHSTSAYVIFLGKNLISWCSNKQHIVSRSSTEAEYRAIASVVAELNWITNLLQELGVKLPCPPKVLCDNIGVTYLCRNPVFHS